MRAIFGLLMCLWAGQLLAYECVSTIDETTPDSRFITYANGTALDSTTRLIWMRCAIGQTWNATSRLCEGDPIKYSWQEALQLAFDYEFAGNKGWRLPNLKELHSIVERQCVRPSLNDQVFSNAPSDDFWTSTPSVKDLERAWVVAFYNGSNAIKQKTLFTYIRLVRNAD